MVVVGGLLVLGWQVFETGSPSWGLWLLWFGLIVMVDLAPVPLPGGGFITASSAVDFAGILVLGPVPVALAEAVSTLALAAGRRRNLRKGLFNAAAFSLSVLAGGTAYLLLGGEPGAMPSFPESLPALLAMAAAYYLVNAFLVGLAVAGDQGRPPRQVWQVNYAWTALHSLAAVAFGTALAVAYVAVGIWGVALFVAPLLLARMSFRLYVDARRDLIEFARVLAGMIDEFDPYTHRHSHRVSRIAARVARELGLSERQVLEVEYSGLLHDIGKVSVTQRDVVQKPGPLTLGEYLLVCRHADIGAEILGQVRAFRRLAPIVRHHHERMDGRGYHRLPGKEVSLSARIVTVADAFDAMTSHRVYRAALSLPDAVAELDRHAGTQFDPAVVAALKRLLEKGEVVPAPQPVPGRSETFGRDLAGAGVA
jgi:putative nucleotidyltransferase with HDIG domain